jgi:AraC-like DNA-binding protein
MQVAYRIVQVPGLPRRRAEVIIPVVRLPEIAVGLVHAERGQRPPRLGAWFGPFRWSQWVIDWCGYAGQSTELLIDGRTLGPYPRPARSWHIFAPGVGYRHRDQAQPAATEQLWFFFQPRRALPMLGDRPFTVIVDEEERLGPVFHAMRELQHRREPGHELALQARALLVFGEVQLASQRGGDGSIERPWRIGGRRRGADSLLHLVERETLRELRSPPSVAEIAERLGMSPSSLSHRFRAETGETVMARVRWLRIREARRLLAEPGATLKDAARRLGFSSAFHLSAQFRRLTGVTPSEYMRQQRV